MPPMVACGSLGPASDVWAQSGSSPRSRAYLDSSVKRKNETEGCFRHQLLLPRPYLVLTKPLRLDIQCQRAASVKIGWKYLDD